MMSNSPLLLVRLTIVVGLFVVMPALAVPPVGQWLDRRLLGKPDQGAAPFEESHKFNALTNDSDSSAAYNQRIPSNKPNRPNHPVQPNFHSVHSPAFSSVEVSTAEGSQRASGNLDASQRIQQIQRRLQEWGASYLVLESANAATGQIPNGNQTIVQTETASTVRSFHFHCQMPLPGRSVYSRAFDAVHDDPVAAMEQVLEAVEQWRTHERLAAFADPSAETETSARSVR